MVLFNRLLIRPGNPKCPKCLREGRLQGDGLAKSSHLVLDCDGQFRVFHFKLKCVGCPAHAAKDYRFSSMDQNFLDLNFEPALQEQLPWAYISHESGVSTKLVDMIGRNRSNGVAISMVTAIRNSAVAKRAVQREMLALTGMYQERKLAGTL